MIQSRTVSFPFQSAPTRNAVGDAYAKLFRHLHPKSKASGLTFDQQFEVFDLAGGSGWENVVNASDTDMMQMAERVDTMLALH